jgi:arginase
MLATDGVAQFGSGMLATEAGLAALRAWAGAVGREVDGLYIAIDFDAIDPADGIAVQMPEPDGIRLERAVEAVSALAGAIPVVGFGATGINLRGRSDTDATVDAVVRLAQAALAG